MARDRLKDERPRDLKMKLIANRDKDGHVYNIPMLLKLMPYSLETLTYLGKETSFLKHRLESYKKLMNYIPVI